VFTDMPRKRRSPFILDYQSCNLFSIGHIDTSFITTAA
jgi:hypothetical protein